MARARTILPCVLLLTLSAAAPAAAQRAGRAAAGRLRIDLHVDFAYHGAFGLGGRVDIPILPQGLLSGGSVQDDLVLSPGVDVFFWQTWRYRYRCGPDWCDSSTWGGTFGVGILALQWNFYFTRWSLFPEIGLAISFGDSYYWNDRYWGGFVWPFFGFGVRYHFSQSNALLFRLSWPAGLSIGITF